MPCRVGITTDPDTRREQWRSQVVGFTNWKVLDSFRSRAAAQEYVTWYARRYGCHAYHGGADVPGL